jgi:hypothetical protein
MSCVTGSTVTLSSSVDGVVGSGLCALGTVTITSSTLTEGAATMTATQTDVGGNVSVASAGLGVVIDATADAAPGTPDMTAGTDSGSSNSDSNTSDTTPDFTMSCVTGSTVTLSSSVDGVVGSGLCALGTVTITSSTLTEGAATMTATQTDVGGNVSVASAGLGVVIDATAPGAPIGAPDLQSGSDTGSSNSDNNTSDTTPTLDVTCSAIGFIVRVYVGGFLNTSHTCVSVGTEAVTLSALTPDGAKSITYREVDLAGNESSDSPTLIVTIDTTADAAPGTPDMTAGTDSGSSNSDSNTSDTTPDFTMSCVTGSTVTLSSSVDGVVGTGLCALGTVTITSSTLTEGAATMTATQTDVGGNVSVASAGLGVVIDATADAAPGTPDMTAGTDSGSSNSDSNTSDTTPDFTMSCVTGSTVTLSSSVDGVVGTGLCALGTVTITSSTLTEGAATMTATQTDVGGNVSVASAGLGVVIDATAPGAPVGAPDLQSGSDTGSSNSDNNTSDTTPTLDVTCSAIGFIVRVYVGGFLNTSHTCVSVGTEAVTLSALTPDGAKSITYREVDLAGNESSDSPTLIVTIDTTADAAPGTPDMTAGTDSGSSNSDSNTSDTTPDFTMSCVTGSTVTLSSSVDGVVGTGLCALGTVTITSSTLTEGAATMTATQTDVGGNVSVASAGLGVVIDATADAAPGTPDMTAGTDSGSSNSDSNTSDTTPDFTMSCVTGSTVTLSSSVDGVVGTGLCALGTVTITSSTLTEGAATMTATQTDVGGNVSVASAGLGVVIDATAPGAPVGAPDLQSGSDTGSSNSDNNTSDTTPTLDVTCSAIGFIVRVYVGGFLNTSHTCVSVGTEAVTLSALTPDGAKSITYREVDLAGNESSDSPTLIVTIDTTADAAPGTPDMTAGTDSGSSNSDSNTSDTTPDFTMSCVTGSTVTLSSSVDGVVGTGLCALGTVTITSSTLTEGAATMTATQTDVGGNVSVASAGLGVVIDATAPGAPVGAPDLQSGSDTGSSNSDNNTSDTTPTLDVTCSAIGFIVRVYVGGFLNTSHTCVSVGTEAVTLSALTPDGAKSITYREVDLAGNESSDSPTLIVTIDTTADAAPGTPDMTAGTDSGSSNSDSNTSDTTPDFTMSCVTGSTVTLSSSVDGVVGSGLCALGTVTITSSTLTEGAATMTATQTDVGGNVSVASAGLGVVIDATADAAPGTPDMTAGTDSGSSNSDSNTSDTTPDFTMSCVTGSTVTLSSSVDGVVGTGLCALGTVTITSSTLTEGAATMTATQTDVGGNVSVASAGLGVVIDATAPGAPVGAPDLQSGSDTGSSNSDNNTSDTTPTLDVTCSAIGFIVRVYVGGFLNTSHTCVSVGTEAVTLSALTPDGAKSITYREVDLAGNESSDSPTLIVTIDTTADAAPGTPDMTAGTDSGSSNSDSNTSDTTPDFTMSCVTGSTVTLSSSVDGVVGTGLCALGTVTITSSTLTEGAATMTATQTDVGGNVSVASAGLGVVIDATADAAPGTPDMTAGTDSGSSNSDSNTSIDT